MHAMTPIELAGDLVAIEPLRVEHAAGLFAAADAEEGAVLRERIAAAETR